MNIDLSKNEIGALLIIQRLIQTQQPLNRQNIKHIAEIKLPAVFIKYDHIIDALHKKKLISGNNDEFLLTTKGKEQLKIITKKHSLHAFFYNEYYQAVLTSKAHALFCKKIYGKNLGQHGMTDMAQLNALLKEMQAAPAMSILDFGCGDGRISEYISDTTHTFVSGVDIADKAIELAQERTKEKEDRIRFYCANLDEDQGALPHDVFDRIIAIDSLFFAKDQKAILETFLKYLKKDGKLGIFYIFPWEPEGLRPEQTTFGKILTELGLHYYTKNFTAQNYEHWIKKKNVLLELEAKFYQEGQEFLFKNRMAECQGGLENFHHYLFVIKIPATH
ncbi:class I SAM-dependent methyltransferase [Chloroflexota bacterium]